MPANACRPESQPSSQDDGAWDAAPGAAGRPILTFLLLLLLAVSAPPALRGQGITQLTGLFPPTVDHRPSQSPVKSQASRGTCIAFSIAAVMETFDGVPADLSEQGAYGYIKLQEFGQGDVSSGGLLANYPDFLTKVGFMHESVAPYEPKAGLWSKEDHLLKKYLAEGRTSIADLMKRAGTTRYRAEASDVIFLGDPEARQVARLKQLLTTGHRAVAVGYTHLYSPRWGKYKSGVITPEDGFVFAISNQVYNYSTAKTLRPNLVDEVLAGKVEVRLATPKSPEDYGGHAVTVVGYTPEGFLIKNSWGAGWGMQGYAVVSYDYHRLFCDEALAVKAPAVYIQPSPLRERPTLYLKTRPIRSGTNAQLRLSLFGPKEGGLAPLRSLKYEVYEQTADGSRGQLAAFPPPLNPAQAATGYPVDVLDGQQPGSGRSGKKYWVQASFATEGELIERIVTFPNVIWGTQEYRGH
jgi:hypothetical protein